MGGWFLTLFQLTQENIPNLHVQSVTLILLEHAVHSLLHFVMCESALLY